MTLRSKLQWISLAAAAVVLTAAGGLSRPRVQRIGMVIGIRPEKIAEYKRLHAVSNPGVRGLLTKYHMRNFSIYLKQFDDGKYYLFGYYEYDGGNYQADMAKLGSEDANLKWLAVTDPMQIPFQGEKGWASMEEVYHKD
jgi:L-rhamnose mutarotase